MIAQCKICGKDFDTNGKGKYCKRCQARILSQYKAWLAMERHVYLKTCIVCGKKIERGIHQSGERGYATTCSRECRHILESITATYRYNRAKKLCEKRRGIIKPAKGRSLLAIREDEARKLGISYGEYMARRRMAAERT